MLFRSPPPPPPVPTAIIGWSDPMAASPTDAQFGGFCLEWAQSEGNLIRGERAPLDDTFRKLARDEMGKVLDIRELDAMHPLDSAAAGRFIKPGTDLGTTYYFGDLSVNRSFGRQLGAELKRLGVGLGQEFRVKLVGFPSHAEVPPTAPPASSPNLYRPK